MWIRQTPPSDNICNFRLRFIFQFIITEIIIVFATTKYEIHRTIHIAINKYNFSRKFWSMCLIPSKYEYAETRDHHMSFLKMEFCQKSAAVERLGVTLS